MHTHRIGVDIGGTFTDFTLCDDSSGVIAIHKQLTTPDDPTRAVLDGVATLCNQERVPIANIQAVVHGTTLVTNAIIERKGANTAMLVTRGFRDVLDIGRECRYDLFDLSLRYPEPAVPRRLRFEVNERVRYDGTEEVPLSVESIQDLIESAIASDRIEAIAVCFLHSYANDSHERTMADWLRTRFPAVCVSLSSEVLPYIREYDRWTTTCLNAYVQPLVDRYLSKLEGGLRVSGFRGSLLVMTSSGTTLTPDIARRFPIRILESGPAAGALMSAKRGQSLRIPQVLSFDMGGTTAKGCIIRDGRPLKRYEMEVARIHEFKKGSGLPVKIPVIDMIEIGAGGGSLAELDDRGVIRVGPRSAGARPGPSCYGIGGALPTLTDADLVLGYLGSSFLGGAMRLDKGAASAAVGRSIAQPLGIDIVRSAWGIHEIINEDVARAFRVHAAERGVDYQKCSMVVFGGAGPLHGARIARKLRIPRVICPIGAGVMSSLGLLSSPVGFEIARSRRVALGAWNDAELRQYIATMWEEASLHLGRAGISPDDVTYSTWLDMRYIGQGYDIEIAVPDAAHGGLVEAIRLEFHAQYREAFGVSFESRSVEIVTWKVEARGPLPGHGSKYQLKQNHAPRSPCNGERLAWNPDIEQMTTWSVYDRYTLNSGFSIAGPALIEERESTCLVGPSDRLSIDDQLNITIEIGF